MSKQLKVSGPTISFNHDEEIDDNEEGLPVIDSEEDAISQLLNTSVTEKQKHSVKVVGVEDKTPRELHIHQDPFGLFFLKAEGGGPVPQELRGKYTGRDIIEEAVAAYNSSH